MKGSLKKTSEITAVLRTGKHVRAESLTLVYLRAQDTKLAVCVGKKFGKSVERSRLKRLLREAFRTHPPALGCHVLLLPKAAENYSFSAFSRDIEKILRKEKLL